MVRVNSLSDEYQRLIRPIEDRLMRSIGRILPHPEDAGEALQATLEKIWKKFSTVQRHPNPQALMLRMAMNASYDLLRKKARRTKREVVGLHESLEDLHPTALERLSNAELQQEIHQAIRRLSRKQAQAVLMRFVQDLAFPDIASALGCNEATARTHVKRGCANLRTIMKRSPSFEPMEVQS